jgi:PTS system N-acetylgalactosamine-specific IIA component
MMTNSGSPGDERSPGPRAVVAGHGEFAAGIISAVQHIGGVGHLFRALSNSALDAAGLDAALRDAVSALGARVVFTDLPAGSCTIAARRLAHEMPGLTVVTGANLPMLLEYALGSGEGRLAADRAAGKGREAITVTPPVNRAEGSRAH